MTWDRLSGVTLAGEYPLEQILEESESGAWFRTFSAPRNLPAVLRIIPDSGEEGERHLARWRRLRLLNHPNLQLLYDCGRAVHHGETLLFAVFEYPDDRLDEALSQGALSETEIRQVLDAAAGALRYLHSQGLVHGSLDAGHIVAMGDRIKLATESVRAAGPGEPEEDFRALRGLLGIPDPAPPLVEKAVEAPAAAPLLPPPTRTRAIIEEEPPPARNWKPLWPIAAGALALLVAVAALSHKSAPAPAPPAAKSMPARTTVPSAPAAAPPVVASEPLPAVGEHRPRGEWRVIVYTFSHLQDAENKARSINRRIPGLKAEVYTPHGANRPPFLVALGGRMSRTDAASLQRKAMSRGMPRDTFIRNYND